MYLFGINGLIGKWRGREKRGRSLTTANRPFNIDHLICRLGMLHGPAGHYSHLPAWITTLYIVPLSVRWGEMRNKQTFLYDIKSV